MAAFEHVCIQFIVSISSQHCSAAGQHKIPNARVTVRWAQLQALLTVKSQSAACLQLRGLVLRHCIGCSRFLRLIRM